MGRLQCYRVDRKKKRQTFQAYKPGKAKAILAQHGQYAAEVRVKDPRFKPELQDVFDSVTYDGEDIVGLEDDYVRLNISELRYVIACVDADGQVSGIPEVSPDLKSAILDAAKKQREKIRISSGAKDTLSPELHETDAALRTFKAHDIDPQRILLISGSTEHLAHLKNLINSAKSRIVIHSTFININSINELLGDLLAAAQRSVQIDILWGQTEPESTEKISDYNQLIQAIDTTQARIDSQGLATQFRFHKTPTNSHSKFIICDSHIGSWGVTIGSCNWLSSRFNRFEASVHIQDPQVASEALSIASTLAIGKLGIANLLSRDLAVSSLRVAKQFVKRGKACENTIKVRIITAPEHHPLIKNASDLVEKYFFVCSHRFSFAGDRPILTPLLAAKKQIPSLDIKIAYGRPSGSMRNRDANEARLALRKLGLNVIKADDPQIHAKFVSWDDSDLVVSSLNWLSASSKGDEFCELGVHLSGGGFATELRDAFESFYARHPTSNLDND